MKSAILILAALLILPCVAGAREEAPPDTTALESMSPAELFVRASSAELQYADVLEPARRALVRRHEESVPYLVTKLDTDEPRERIALERLFVAIGEDAVPALIEALDREARRDDTTRGARLASYVLARIGDRAAVGPLVDQRSHGEWKMRSSVADALGHLGGSRAVDALVELMTDADSSVRKAAAASLYRIARDDPGSVRKPAERALLDALDDEFYGVRFAASDALGRLGEEVIDPLAEVADDGGGHERVMAIRALGVAGGREALRKIASYLESEDWAVRAHAAEAAGAAGSMTRAVRRKLEELTDDPHPLVAGKAQAALAACDEG
jgi:HEAT repeat protein